MKVQIDLRKSVNENAGRYYDLVKKAKKKWEGAVDALRDSKKKLERLQSDEKKYLVEEEKKEKKRARKKEWYEKFHWFISSEGFLCFGGKDATSNEIVVKKHVEKNDLVFHTELPGSPFFVIRNGQEAGEKTKEECAIATACYSRAWKEGHSSAEVLYVLPEQVTKEAKAGEVVGRGSFMIYGKREILRVGVEYAIGIFDEEIVSGPITAVDSKTAKHVVVIPGREKKSSIAKLIKKKLGGGDVDDIVRFLPGTSAVKK
jgi:predicted ribosome quality control (RQC) complex YloA/Tae2 family protein